MNVANQPIPAKPVQDIFHDLRLRSVMWRDLVPVAKLEIVVELLLPLTWLAGSLLVAERGYYVIVALDVYTKSSIEDRATAAKQLEDSVLTSAVRPRKKSA